MDRESAARLINQTLGASFDKDRFDTFARNLFNSLDKSEFSYHGAYIPEAYRPFISKYERVGKYADPLDNQIDILIVHLQKGAEARTMQRNFIASYLNGGRGGKQKDAALVAFVTPDQSDWRLSLVKMEYKDFGKTKELTPARRYSFLVGANENSHTARQQLIHYLIKSDDILLSDLVNAFNVEKVSNEFFAKYKELFLQLKESIDDIVKGDGKVKSDFEAKGINTADFAKKLLGQIVFLYFLQKKGWLGVSRDEPWGTGPKGFLRSLFNKDFVNYTNFFNDVLEPLFYEALAVERTEHYYDHLKAKIPFLNGGLFEPINDYDWIHTDIRLPNDLFSNQKRTKEGDTGSGILDIFDRYNFTVKEDEPLEKEVAVDPEMLGKVFENLLEIIDRKSKGSYYTPREIVHYMCQESLINHLATELAYIHRTDLADFIKHSDLSIQNDAQVQKLGSETATYKYKLPESIRNNAFEIDKKLADIKICDPAIGSGAFPVGMMNEIVRARESLTSFINKPHRTVYEFKRHAIQECLYGVDIDPGAVEIAKLRLWLSLVVDEDDINQIRPLPNLDYKIMQGDSLVDEFQGIKLYDDSIFSSGLDDVSQEIIDLQTKIHKLQNEYVTLHNQGELTTEKKNELSIKLQQHGKLLKLLVERNKTIPEKAGLFDYSSEAKRKSDELKELHVKFFSSSQKSEKDKLRKRIDELEWELIETTLKEQGKLEALSLLHKNRTTNSKPFFLWRLHFSEVFQNGSGFNVIIANPPYGADYPNENKAYFKRTYLSASSRTGAKGSLDTFLYIKPSSLP